MALKGIWQNANGGTRKQNGHWQSSVAAAYNANLRSWGAVNYYSVSGLSSDGANTFINFKAGTWREAWTITARYKTAQIPGRIIFSEDTTGGAWNARTAIRLYSTAARNEFIAAMNAPTVTTIGETVITQTFTLTIPAATGMSGVDPMTIDATGTTNTETQTATLTGQLSADSIATLQNDYDIDLDSAIIGAGGMFLLKPFDDYTAESYPAYSPDLAIGNIYAS